MNASLFYRVAAVLLVLFAVGHTLGFRQTRGTAGADTVVGLMKSVHFHVQGFERDYWGFYVGFGLFVTVFLLFAAALSWQLGGATSDTLARMPVATWGLAACFAAITVTTWRYFFMAPGIFSTLITLCLILAAWSAAPRSP